jgi:hypothetical protein
MDPSTWFVGLLWARPVILARYGLARRAKIQAAKVFATPHDDLPRGPVQNPRRGAAEYGTRQAAVKADLFLFCHGDSINRIEELEAVSQPQLKLPASATSPITNAPKTLAELS